MFTGIMIAAVVGMALMMANDLRDALEKVSLLLPNGAANTTSTGLETGVRTSLGVPARPIDYVLTAPLLTTTQQPDAKTMKYDILVSDNLDMSSPTTYITTALTQTGAGSAGCAAATFTFALPSNINKKYVGIKATGSASGDSSAASATLEALA